MSFAAAVCSAFLLQLSISRVLGATQRLFLPWWFHQQLQGWHRYFSPALGEALVQRKAAGEASVWRPPLCSARALASGFQFGNAGWLDFSRLALFRSQVSCGNVSSVLRHHLLMDQTSRPFDTDAPGVFARLQPRQLVWRSRRRSGWTCGDPPRSRPGWWVLSTRPICCPPFTAPTNCPSEAWRDRRTWGLRSR